METVKPDPSQPERLTIHHAMVCVIVIAIPLAFWAWRFRSDIPFPSRLDLITSAVSIVSLGLVASLFLGGRRRLRLPQWVFSGLLVSNTLAAVWFTSVDWVWIHQDCNRCNHGKNFVEARFFGRVREESLREYPTWAEFIAADLGIPCTHDSTTSWHKLRWLGGFLMVENNSGIDRLSGGPTYSDCERATIRAWAAEDPALVAEFRKQFLEIKNPQYRKDFQKRLREACPETWRAFPAL